MPTRIHCSWVLQLLFNLVLYIKIIPKTVLCIRSLNKAFLKDVAFSEAVIKHMSRKMAYACQDLRVLHEHNFICLIILLSSFKNLLLNPSDLDVHHM